MWLRSNLGAAALVAAVAALPAAARAADPITDPRAYCDHAVDLVAAGDLDDLADDLLAHSNGRILEGELRAALAGFAALPVKAGLLRQHEHVSEWKAGGAFVRHYYILIYERAPLFLKCSMYRPDQQWFLVDFAGNTDPEKIGLAP